MSSLLRRIARKKGIAIWSDAKVVEIIAEPTKRRSIKKGTTHRHIYSTKFDNVYLHATKGFRRVGIYRRYGYTPS